MAVINSLNQNNKPSIEKALARPNCGKKNALKLQILHKDPERGEVPRKTHYYPHGGTTHYSTWHKVEAKVKDACSFCTYVYGEFTPNAENLYQVDSDAPEIPYLA